MNEKIVSGLIYGLHNGDGEIRYIGYTINLPANRLSQHRHAARSGNCSHKNNWIRSIGINNVHMEILEYYTDIPFKSLENREISAIAAAEESGLRLTNATKGGGSGVSVGKTWVEMYGKPRMDARKGMKYSDEEKKTKYSYMMGESNAFYGRTHSDETKAIMSAKAKSRAPISEETREKMAAAARVRATTSRTVSPETREKLRVSAHNQWHVSLGKISPKCSLCTLDTPR